MPDSMSWMAFLLLMMPVVALAAVLVAFWWTSRSLDYTAIWIQDRSEAEMNRLMEQMAERTDLAKRMDEQATLMKDTIAVLVKVSETSNNLAHSILSSRGQGIRLDRQVGEGPAPAPGVTLPPSVTSPPAPATMQVSVSDPALPTPATKSPSAVEIVRGKPS